MNIETIKHQQRVELPAAFAHRRLAEQLSDELEKLLIFAFDIEPECSIATTGITIHAYFTTPPLDATQRKNLRGMIQVRIDKLTGVTT